MADQRTANRVKAPLLRTFSPVPGAPDVLVSPPLSDAPRSNRDPTVILLFTWMDAQLPNVYKYTESYNRVFPGATQIIVRSRMQLFWQTQKTQMDYYKPAMKILKEHGVINPGDNDRLLLHTFSNGGCLKLVTLGNAIRQHDPSISKETSAFSPRAVVLDSCPGTAGMVGGMRAFTAGIRNKLLRYLARTVVGFLLVLLYLYTQITRSPPPFEVMREDLLDSKVLPHSSPRTYIYSAMDLLVSIDAVEAHAQAAKRKGIPVRQEKYDRTPHVNHLKENPERYWEIVRETWESAKGI